MKKYSLRTARKNACSITIAITTKPKNPQVFNFMGDLGSFSLQDDGTDNRKKVFNLVAGKYCITESEVLGWIVDTIAIFDSSGLWNYNLVTRTATVEVKAGENVLIRFDNSQTRISVWVATKPESVKMFNFTGDLGSFSLQDDGTDNRKKAFNLAAGKYTIIASETIGWGLVDVTIHNPSGKSISDINARKVTIDLEAGEEVTIKFDYIQSRITVLVNAKPKSPQAFNFTGSLGSFTLKDDGSEDNSKTFEELAERSYVITASDVLGWGLIGIVVRDPFSNSDPQTRTAIVDITAGDNVFIRFDYTQNKIQILVNAKPKSPQAFNFTGSLGSFTLKDDGSEEYQKIFNAKEGKYVITESETPGWDLVDIIVHDPHGHSDRQRSALIDMAAGDNVIVRFDYNQIKEKKW